MSDISKASLFLPRIDPFLFNINNIRKMDNEFLDLEIKKTTPQYNGYATFWERFGAALIDGIILFVVGQMILGAFGINFLEMYQSAAKGGDPVEVFGTNFNTASILSLVFDCFYFAQQESSDAQATLGKRAVGLIVTDMQGERLSFQHACLRFVIKQLFSFVSLLSSFLSHNIVSTLFLMSIVGYLIQPFTPKKQAFHDMVAKTLVYKK